MLILGLTGMSAQSALVGRLQDGVGDYLAYYDDVLDITWLGNANLAATETFGVAGIGVGGFDGRMAADTVADWLAAMNADGGTGYLGISDWRAPLTDPVNGTAYDTAGTENNFLGITDIGYNISAPGTHYAGSTGSEMAHLYYNTLANLGRNAPDGTDPQTGYKNKDWALFTNVELHRYLSGSEFDALNMYGFAMDSGQQRAMLKDPNGVVTETGFVWAVTSGDVALIYTPIPAAAWLFGTGLLALAGMAGRKKQRQVV